MSKTISGFPVPASLRFAGQSRFRTGTTVKNFLMRNFRYRLWQAKSLNTKKSIQTKPIIQGQTDIYH